MPVGRPRLDYNPETAKLICDEITTGKTIASASKNHGMPSERQIYRWLDESEEFRQMYARARDRRADARHERIDQVILDMRAKEIDPAQARVEIDAIKWQCSKEAPRRYGERIEIAGDPDNPLNVNVTQSAELLTNRIDRLIARSETESVPGEPE